MSTKSISAAFVLAAVATLAAGCQTTSTLTKRSQFLSIPNKAQVKVLSKDSVLYDLNKIYLRDSTVYGEGAARTSNGVEHFKGEIALSNIQYIQSTDVDTWKTALAIGAVAFVGVTAYSYVSDNTSGLAIRADRAWIDPRFASNPGVGGDNSCPYIYSWNGERYILEGEAYGVAWGKALEMQTVTVLPSLRADHGMLNVRLTNERPETHYYNAVSLAAVESDENAEVVADPFGVLWPVHQLQSPLRAADSDGEDILDRIGRRDGIYWKSALRSISPGSAFEDVIELVLPKAAYGKEGMIVVRAINAGIIEVVFRKLGELLGEDYLTFLRALEHDPELIGLMKEWMVESSLKIDMWDGAAWKSAGSILPEASAVAFTRGVRVNAENVETGSVRVRLKCLAGVWNIDEVGIDWTPVAPLHPTEVPLLSAVGPDDRTVMEALERVDERYAILLPGQEMNVKYRAKESTPSVKVTYALGVRGYLHEWLPGASPEGASIITASMTGGMKIAYLKTLLRMKNVFLPPIYAEWKKSRE